MIFTGYLLLTLEPSEKEKKKKRKRRKTRQSIERLREFGSEMLGDTRQSCRIEAKREALPKVTCVTRESKETEEQVYVTLQSLISLKWFTTTATITIHYQKPSLLPSLFPSIGKRERMCDRKERERASEKEIIRRSKLKWIAFMTVWCTRMSAFTVKLSIVFNDINTLFLRQNSHRNLSRLESLPRVKRDARNEESPANLTGEKMQKIRERKKGKTRSRASWLAFFSFFKALFQNGTHAFYVALLSGRRICSASCSSSTYIHINIHIYIIHTFIHTHMHTWIN